MLQTTLTYLSGYLEAKAPNFLKSVYTNVTQEDLGKNREGDDLGVWPIYWSDGDNEGKPLLHDALSNYGYLRQIAEAEISPGRLIASNSQEAITNYPIRLVVHYVEPGGGNTTDDMIYLFLQWLENSAPDALATAGISRVEFSPFQTSPFKDLIIEEETSGIGDPLPIFHRVFAIDFVCSISYVPGACTITKPESICL